MNSEEDASGVERVGRRMVSAILSRLGALVERRELPIAVRRRAPIAENEFGAL